MNLSELLVSLERPGASSKNQATGTFRASAIPNELRARYPVDAFFVLLDLLEAYADESRQSFLTHIDIYTDAVTDVFINLVRIFNHR